MNAEDITFRCLIWVQILIELCDSSREAPTGAMVRLEKIEAYLIQRLLRAANHHD